MEANASETQSYDYLNLHSRQAMGIGVVPVGSSCSLEVLSTVHETSRELFLDPPHVGVSITISLCPWGDPGSWVSGWAGRDIEASAQRLNYLFPAAIALSLLHQAFQLDHKCPVYGVRVPATELWKPWCTAPLSSKAAHYDCRSPHPLWNTLKSRCACSEQVSWEQKHGVGLGITENFYRLFFFLS